MCVCVCVCVCVCRVAGVEEDALAVRPKQGLEPPLRPRVRAPLSALGAHLPPLNLSFLSVSSPGSLICLFPSPPPPPGLSWSL